MLMDKLLIKEQVKVNISVCHELLNPNKNSQSESKN